MEENRQLQQLLTVCYNELREVNEMIELEARRVEAEGMLERREEDFRSNR